MCVALNPLAIAGATVSAGLKVLKWVQVWGREKEEKMKRHVKGKIGMSVTQRKQSECSGKRSAED